VAKDLLQRLRKTRVTHISHIPELPRKCAKKLICLDAVGCRSNALLKCSRGLPVFSAIDPIMPFSRELLPKADFVFVEVEGEVHSEYFPYTGARWYAAEVVEYMLQRDTIFDDDCKAILCATRHVPAEELQDKLNILREVYQEVRFHPPMNSTKTEAELRADHIKGCFLSVIGLWNCTQRFQYTREGPTCHEIDAGGGVRLRRHVGNGRFLFTTFREKLSLYSMAPWGRIALDVEQMRVAQALETAEKFKDHVEVVGVHVDGVFLLQHSDENIDEQLVSQHCWPDGTRQFQLKREKPEKVPTWPREDNIRSQQLKFEKPDWIILEEEKFADWEEIFKCVVDLFQVQKGLLLAGYCGVGKSTFLKELMSRLSELMKGKHFAAALRHCTCKLICGKTIAHHLQRYRSKGGAPAPGTIVIIDEWSEVQLHTWSELAQWTLVGVHFILVGDADGQRKPIFDKWQDSMNLHDIRKSSLISTLCGGLRLNLSKNRRGTDPKLFKDMVDLYPFADDMSRKHSEVKRLLREYPMPAWDKQVSTYFVVKHSDRVSLNQMANWKLAANRPEIEFLRHHGELRGELNQPQDMIVWPGLELICSARRGYKNHPLSGVVYVVEKWAGGYLYIRQHDDYDGKPLITPSTAAEEPELDDPDDAELEVDAGYESDPDVVEDLPESRRTDAACVKTVVEVKRADGSVVKKDTFKMTFKRASELLRLQHATVYAQMQGRTFRGSIALLDLHKEYVTMRDIITSMGRPTKGEHLHFVSRDQQKRLLAEAEKLVDGISKWDLEKRVKDLRQARSA